MNSFALPPPGTVSTQRVAAAEASVNQTFVSKKGDNSWWKFSLQTIVATLLCAAASPSPIALPLALVLAFQTEQVQYAWLWGIDTLGPTTFTALGIPVIAILTYWAHGLLLLAVDCYWRPEVIKQFKIQKTKAFDTALLKKVCQNLLLNQIFIIFPVGAFYAWMLQKGVGLYVSTELPGPAEMIGHILLNIVTNEVMFYYGHRLFHESKWLYQTVHKQHHEFTSPIGLVASYCHPLEMLVSNILPLTSAGIIFGSHLYTLVRSSCTWVEPPLIMTPLHGLYCLFTFFCLHSLCGPYSLCLAHNIITVVIKCHGLPGLMSTQIFTTSIMRSLNQITVLLDGSITFTALTQCGRTS